MYDTGKREAFEKLIKDLESIKEEEDREELINIMDHHFDPEKKPFKPIVTRRENQDRRNNNNNNNNNMRRRRGMPRNMQNKENRDSRSNSRRSPRRQRNYSGKRNMRGHQNEPKTGMMRDYKEQQHQHQGNQPTNQPPMVAAH